MFEKADNDAVLGRWLELAEEVARRHRQGHVLGTDPTLVLRGAPAVWRPAAGGGIPADDVVALAGAALPHLSPDDPARPALVEAAAGCLGSDLPALLRRLRPLLEQHRADGDNPPGSTAADDDERAEHDRGDGPTAERRTRPETRRGVGLAAAGAVTAVVLVLLGATTSLRTGDDRSSETSLVEGPVTVEGRGRAVLRWDPPHLLVDVAQVRYRYRLDGADDVAWRDDPRRPTLVVVAGDRRWEVSVPALEPISGTAGPR